MLGILQVGVRAVRAEMWDRWDKWDEWDEWECEQHGQRCGTGEAGGAGEMRGL